MGVNSFKFCIKLGVNQDNSCMILGVNIFQYLFHKIPEFENNSKAIAPNIISLLIHKCGKTEMKYSPDTIENGTLVLCF